MVTIKQQGPPLYIFEDFTSGSTLEIRPDVCIECQLCTYECPNDAVQPNPDSGGIKFYVGSCEMVGDCAAVCPTDALVYNGGCKEDETAMVAVPGDGSVSTVGVGTTERLYSWVILRNHMNFWKVTSIEKATLKKLTKPDGSIDWQFQDIEHLSHNLIGQTFGVNVDINVSSSKTVGLYHAAIKLQGVCVLSAVCKGFPLTNSYPFDAEKIFNI